MNRKIEKWGIDSVLCCLFRALLFRLESLGLALLFSLLILGIGALVVLYGAYYLSPTDSSPRFFSYLLLFMGAMLGVVLSRSK